MYDRSWNRPHGGHIFRHRRHTDRCNRYSDAALSLYVHPASVQDGWENVRGRCSDVYAGCVRSGYKRYGDWFS